MSPFAMSADGDNVNFTTSLTQWGSAFSAADIESLKQAQTAIGEDVALPRAAKPGAPQFDMWAQGRSERFSEAGSMTKIGSAFTTYVGADYRWHKTLLIGGMVQIDDSRQTILAVPDAVEGNAYMAGSYMAYRLTPNLVLDANAVWGTAHDNALAGTASADFGANRTLAEARLSGNWGWNAWQLSQSGAITYFDETSNGGIANVPGTSVDVTRFSIGPKLKRHIDASNGATIEPFAFFKSSINLAEAWSGVSLAQNTIGGGVTLAKPDKYNLRATADFTESSNGTDDVATGKVSVSVPSGLFGF